MCVHAKLLQWCLTLCEPRDCSPSGSSVMGLSRQEYWSGLPCPPPGDLPDPGIEPESFMSPALVGRFFTVRATWEAPLRSTVHPKPSTSDTGTVWLREGSKKQTSKPHGLSTSYKCAKYLIESYKLTDS